MEPRSFSHAEWMWNWPDTLVVDEGWQDFRSETLLVYTTKVLKEEIHLVMSELLIVQAEGILEYTVTEATNELRSLTFAIGEQTSEESGVQFEPLQESAEVSTVLQDVQGILFKVTSFMTVIYSLKKGTNVLNFMGLCTSNNLGWTQWHRLMALTKLD